MFLYYLIKQKGATVSKTKVYFYRVDLCNTSNECELDYDEDQLRDIISILIEQKGKKQKGFISIDISPSRETTNAKPKETLDFFQDDSYLFGRLCRKKPNNQIIKRNYDTLSADSVFQPQEEVSLGIEEYSFFVLDPTAGILLMATRQGAPSQRALTALSKTFSIEKTMKFKEIPNNDGVRLFYESSSPEINRITVELPSPDAEFLQRVLMLPEGKIMEMLTDGVAHVDLVLKPEPRNAMLKGTQAVREAIAHLQRHLPGFDKAVVRGKSNSFTSRDFDLKEQFFSYSIDISKTHVVGGKTVSYRLDEIVDQYRTALHNAYDTNRDYVLHLAGR